MEITVEVKKVKPTEQVTEKFKKREVIVTGNSNPSYPQVLSFQVTQDKCDKVDNIKTGDTIKASINLRGREYKDKNGKESVFNTIEMWRWDIIGGQPTPIPTVGSDQDDDLPF